MSSARRLQEDYRRIIGLQDETRGLDDDLPRMRIGGQRGVWQIGNNALKTGSAGGEDEDGNATNPVTPDETDTNLNKDGSGQGDQNTGDGIGGGGGDDGSDFIIDPEDPPAGVDVNSDTFGSNWASGGVKSFVDCETNQCIELVEVGGFVPPEGWDDADNAPIDPDYISGQWVTSSGLWSAQSEYHIAPSAAGSRSELFRKLPASVCVSTGGGGVCREWSTSKFFTSDGNVIRYEGPTSGRSIQVFDQICTSATNQYCDPSYEGTRPEYWPSDNCIQLAPNSDGNWAASDRDPDVTAKYSEPKSTLELCTPSGEPIDIYKRAGGGHVYFNRDQGIWAASDSSGRVRSFGSSSTLDQEIAR